MMCDDFPELFRCYRAAGRKNIEEYITKLRENNIITGIELDIYSDGTIVFEDDLFSELDLVIGSIHLLDNLLKKKNEELIIEEFKNSHCLCWNAEKLIFSVTLSGFFHGQISLFLMN
jgi:histidinol phosphatase-like PHP family hydrolase